MSTNTIDIDPDALDRFMGQFVTDLGATLSAALVVIGDELGLYRALDEAGPLNADALAARTGTDARYVREWLSNQAAGGYVSYDASSDTFLADARAVAGPGPGGQPGLRAGGVPVGHGADQGRADDPRRVPQRGGRRLARARPRPVRRDRAVLPSRLQRQPRLGLATGA